MTKADTSKRPRRGRKRNRGPVGRRLRALRHWVENALIRATVWLLHRIPYRWRVPFGGWVFAHIIAPVAGYRRRIRANLELVMPDLDEAEKARLVREVPRNIGRTVTELYSPDEFLAIARRTQITGPGLAALERAQHHGRPAILVSGHFGNYDAIRAGLLHRGHRIGGLYRAMNNRRFNAHYVATISRIGTPLFERGRRGLAEMMRFLRGGGTLAILIDQRMGKGAPLRFFGRTAWTALSAADLALKYDAALIPCYAIRRPDGMTFDVVLEAPLPHSDAETMTQALNDSLEAQVRAHMDQWFWLHKRWKLPKRARGRDVTTKKEQTP
ncbi:lauroyl acyltransferase [Sediminimonas sp.]|uniref:lysophospholipid acyltransferase family protein n=1 Tax=Sediminimonas sp. TaxID=2823379 RepID=UPI0025E60B5D|nr:lauroyl acyltransferase [Sediminimonas sp.]